MMAELKLFSKKDSDSSSIDNQDTEDPCKSGLEFEQGATSKSERGQWGGRFEFLLAIIGYTVGVGSIWRFPIICAKNGGGAFLIPFMFFLITCGGPLYYLEVCLGQFTGKSAVLAFELCPLFKGLGFLMVMLSFVVTWYILVVLMWTLYFLYSSFFPVLPWTTCDNWWNTEKCRVPLEPGTSGQLNYTRNGTDAMVNFSMTTASDMTSDMTINADSSPAFEFWTYNVLKKSSGLEDVGSMQIHLIICLFLAWAIIVLAVIRGVKTLGKVVYVTATAPYIFLTIMFIRGLTLDGAVDGILYYITPDFAKLSHYEVWLEAAVQVFYSLGPTWGGVITMASYNKFHKKSFWDTAFCCGTDLFTAFYSGLVVFSIIGFMAKESGATVEEISKVSGPGLVFVAYPTALSRMPFPQFWSVMFFLMFVTVALDSDFGMFETVTSAVIDLFPEKLTKRRTQVNILTGISMFLLSLPFTCGGGIYLFQLVDWYSSAFALLLGSALEGIITCWIYGADRFSKDIAMMTGKEVSVFLRILWVIVLPTCMVVSFLLLLSGYSQPDYGDGYKYQPYAIAIGIILGILPILGLIGGGVWQIASVKGNIVQRISILLKPSKSWGPSDSVHREIYRLQPYEYQSSYWQRFMMNIRGPKGTPCF